MADLFEITGMSLKSAVDGTFKNPGAWLVMGLITAIVCYISGLFSAQLDMDVSPLTPLGIVLLVVMVLLIFFITGAYVKTLRNEKPSFKNFGKTVKEGILYTLVVIIYTIILMLLAGFMAIGGGEWGSILTEPFDLFVYYFAITICWIIFALLFVLVVIIGNPASVNFAETGKFGAAFRLEKLMDMIHAITWKKCILGTILQTAIFALLVVIILSISYLFVCIPVVGDFIGVIFAGLMIPFATIFLLNFCARLFEGVNNVQN